MIRKKESELLEKLYNAFLVKAKGKRAKKEK